MDAAHLPADKIEDGHDFTGVGQGFGLSVQRDRFDIQHIGRYAPDRPDRAGVWLSGVIAERQIEFKVAPVVCAVVYGVAGIGTCHRVAYGFCFAVPAFQVDAQQKENIFLRYPVSGYGRLAILCKQGFQEHAFSQIGVGQY